MRAKEEKYGILKTRKRTNNDLLKQLEETIEENEKIKKESKPLRGYKAEACFLREKIEKLESEMDKRIE